MPDPFDMQAMIAAAPEDVHERAGYWRGNALVAVAELARALREVADLRWQVKALRRALPDCPQCEGLGHIDHEAKLTGANQHSACRERCDACEGTGAEL